MSEFFNLFCKESIAGTGPPDLVKELASLVPGSRHEVIAGAGHIVCVEQPDRLAALIRDFFGSFRSVS